jgi:hypothetical protein
MCSRTTAPNLLVFMAAPEQRHAAALVAMWMSDARPGADVHPQFHPGEQGRGPSPGLQEYVKTDPAFKGFLDLAPNGWRWPSLPSYDKINKAVQDSVDAVMRQEISARAGLAKAQSEAQALLDEDVRLMG